MSEDGIDDRIKYAMDGIERLYPSSFKDFYDRSATENSETARGYEVEKARRLVQDITKGFENAPRYADADELSESADVRGIKTVLNLFARAEILPTWNDSAPFTFYTSEFDPEPLEKAFEYVTGQEYEKPVEDSFLGEKDGKLLEDSGDDTGASFELES